MPPEEFVWDDFDIELVHATLRKRLLENKVDPKTIDYILKPTLKFDDVRACNFLRVRRLLDTENPDRLDMMFLEELFRHASFLAVWVLKRAVLSPLNFLGTLTQEQYESLARDYRAALRDLESEINDLTEHEE